MLQKDSEWPEMDFKHNFKKCNILSAGGGWWWINPLQTLSQGLVLTKLFTIGPELDKKLERALKLLSDWSLETSRSFLAYFHHPTGTHSVRTKNLRDKISLHPEAWSRAAEVS